MLGSVADAEDVVQDAWLRWSAADGARYSTSAPTWFRSPRASRSTGWLRAEPPGELCRAVAAGAPADGRWAGRLRSRRTRAGGGRRARREGVPRPARRPRDAVAGRAGGVRAPRGLRHVDRRGRWSAGPHRGRRPADGAPRPRARARPAAPVRRRPAGAARGDRAVLRRGRAAATSRRCWPRSLRTSSWSATAGARPGGAAADHRRRQGRPVAGRDRCAGREHPGPADRSGRGQRVAGDRGLGGRSRSDRSPSWWPTAASSRSSSS